MLVSGGQRHHLERSPFVHRGSPGCRFGGRAGFQSGIGRTEGLWGLSGLSQMSRCALPPLFMWIGVTKGAGRFVMSVGILCVFNNL